MSSCSVCVCVCVCEECVQTKPRQKNTFCASLVLPEGHQSLWAVFILFCQDRLRIDSMLMSALYHTMSSFSLITEPESDGTDLTLVLCLRCRLTFTLSHLGLSLLLQRVSRLTSILFCGRTIFKIQTEISEQLYMKFKHSRFPSGWTGCAFYLWSWVKCLDISSDGIVLTLFIARWFGAIIRSDLCLL